MFFHIFVNWASPSTPVDANPIFKRPHAVRSDWATSIYENYQFSLKFIQSIRCIWILIASFVGIQAMFQSLLSPVQIETPSLIVSHADDAIHYCPSSESAILLSIASTISSENEMHQQFIIQHKREFPWCRKIIRHSRLPRLKTSAAPSHKQDARSIYGCRCSQSPYASWASVASRTIADVCNRRQNQCIYSHENVASECWMKTNRERRRMAEYFCCEKSAAVFQTMRKASVVSHCSNCMLLCMRIATTHIQSRPLVCTAHASKTECDFPSGFCWKYRIQSHRHTFRLCGSAIVELSSAECALAGIVFCWLMHRFTSLDALNRQSYCLLRAHSFKQTQTFSSCLKQLDRFLCTRIVRVALVLWQYLDVPRSYGHV